VANSAVHRTVAFAAIATLSHAEDQRNGTPTVRPILDGAVAALLTNLPDKLEPATNPNHRQICHSLVFAFGVGYLTYQAYNWRPKTDWQRIVRWLALVGGCAYLTHLAIDACSPKSLPLVGKL
jgi:membrane-bound metal-dependent hydrolase YbcI (DUF457 family)